MNQEEENSKAKGNKMNPKTTKSFKLAFLTLLIFPNITNACSGYMVDGVCTKCDQESGYYKHYGGDGNRAPTCRKCDPACNTCRSAGTSLSWGCIKCAESAYSITKKEDRRCVSCHQDCASCIGSSNQSCKTCKPGSVRTDPSRSASSCITCHPSCSNCVGQAASQCLSCKDPNQRIFSGGTLNPGACVSNCGNDYYKGPTHCLPCHQSCNGCTGPTDYHCKECRYELAGSRNYKWTINSRCAIACNGGAFPDDKTKDCQTCFSGCLLCSYIKAQCYQCNPGMVLEGKEMTTCVTKCLRKQFVRKNEPTTYKLHINDAGKTAQLDTCIDCHETCATCKEASETDCTSCELTPEEEALFLTPDGRCAKSCPVGYFARVRGFKCHKCYPGCDMCLDASPTSCVMCQKGKIRRLDGSCGEECPAHHFPMSAAKPCVACHSKCKECLDGASTSCTECYGEDYLQLDNSCASGCRDGSFKNTLLFKTNFRRCLPCHESCLTCDGAGSSDCIICKKIRVIEPESGQEKLKIPYLDQGFCRPDCNEDGLYNLNSTHCGNCAQRCARCSSGQIEDCSRCLVGTLMNEETKHCVTRCQPGFYDDKKGFCRRCHPRCETCTGGSASECLSCPKKTTLDAQKGPSSCTPIEGYYYNEDTPEACYRSCRDCKAGGEFDCLSCTGSLSLRKDGSCGEGCSETEYVSNVPGGSGNKCEACHEACFSCDGEGNRKCLSCSQVGNVVIKELSFHKSGFCIQCSTQYKEYAEDCYMVREPKLFEDRNGKAVDLYSAISFKIFFPGVEELIQRMVNQIKLGEVFSLEINQMEAGKDYQHRFEWFENEAFVTLNFTTETKKTLRIVLNPLETTLLPLRTSSTNPNIAPEAPLLIIPKSSIFIDFLQLKQDEKETIDTYSKGGITQAQFTLYSTFITNIVYSITYLASSGLLTGPLIHIKRCFKTLYSLRLINTDFGSTLEGFFQSLSSGFDAVDTSIKKDQAKYFCQH